VDIDAGAGGGPARVPLGVVGAPHGVRGDVHVRLYNPASTLLDARREAWLRGASGLARVRLERARRHGQGLIVSVTGHDTREAAESLRGAELCLERQELPRPARGECYLVDLVGLAARTPDGTVVGTVEDTIAYPAAAVLVVRGADGVREVPAIAPYLVSIDVPRGCVVVDRLADLDLVPEPRRAARTRRARGARRSAALPGGR
jgi:16S rRNA processing protein RimM